jgi:uncharacterized protein (DUF1697 family)
LTTYIALLRGINVGAHHRIKMQDLKELLASMRLENVTTYIQSGNVIFHSSEEKDFLQNKMENEIRHVFGFSAPVILRTDQELKEIILSCPYAEVEGVHLALLQGEPTEKDINILLGNQSAKEECYVIGKEVYLFLHEGIRNSKLASSFQKLETPSTVRNWKTIKKLKAMVMES